MTYRWITIPLLLTLGLVSSGRATCLRTCVVTFLGPECETPSAWPSNLPLRIGAQCERTCCTRPDPGPRVCGTQPDSTLPEFFCIPRGGGAFSFSENRCGRQFELIYEVDLAPLHHQIVFSPYNGPGGTCEGTIVADFDVEQSFATTQTPPTFTPTSTLSETPIPSCTPTDTPTATPSPSRTPTEFYPGCCVNHTCPLLCGPTPTPQCGGVCNGGPCLTSGGAGGNCLQTTEGCQCILEVTPTATPPPSRTPTEFFPTCCRSASGCRDPRSGGAILCLLPGEGSYGAPFVCNTQSGQCEISLATSTPTVRATVSQFTPTRTTTPTPNPSPTEFFPGCCANNTCPLLCEPTPTPAPDCQGDCDGDHSVQVNELVVAVRIALGTLPGSSCLALHCSTDTVSIECLVRAVSHALQGCP